MGHLEQKTSLAEAMHQLLGYLNFSTGGFDATFFTNLNRVALELAPAKETPVYLGEFHRLLRCHLAEISRDHEVFKNARQVERVIDLVFLKVLPGYQAFHADLIPDIPPPVLFNPFFIGRTCQAVLTEFHSADNDATVVDHAIDRLNDYLGHRPVATLESRNIEPYKHEWCRPIPLYIREVGAAVGPYQKLVTQTIEILGAVDPALARMAYFDLNRLSELAMDPRAFDFDHPVNKRPNHHFGQWDPNCIDNEHFYRRFVIHRVTLDALLQRIETEPSLDPQELLFEAAAVLGGTILMASGISGSGPGTFDSNTTLESLLPIIAAYRDTYYEQLIGRLSGSHRQRLVQESKTRRQPFGGARQSLNAALSQLRANQLIHVQLATLYARMGFLPAAKKQSEIVQVASARMLSQVDCLITSGRALIEAGQLEEALRVLPTIMDLVQRGIECGAIVDPWNLLGFGGNYSLFPAQSNSIRDHRVDELVDLVEHILAYCSQLLSEAAAVDNQSLCGRIKLQLDTIAHWWYQFAPHEVSSAEAVNPREIVQAADLVAQALNLWHRGGAETGDIGFWSKHAKMFDSPQAYSLVIDALMQRDDLTTAMALLVHWLSQSDRVPLRSGISSFHHLALRWIGRLREQAGESDGLNGSDQTWNQIRKFYDFVEANADEYWRIPEFHPGHAAMPTAAESETDDEPEDDSIFSAAYENVVYKDTTDDDHDGDIFDTNLAAEDELENEVNRLTDRLDFLQTLANFWYTAATTDLPPPQVDPLDGNRVEHLKNRRVFIQRWIEQADKNRNKLGELLHSVHQYRLPHASGDADSLGEYDRCRLFKESLMERVIVTSIETENAIRILLAIKAVIDFQVDQTPLDQFAGQGDREFSSILAAIVLGDAQLVARQYESIVKDLQERSLLYVPLAKGGDPADIVSARARQDAIKELLKCLARMGMFEETHGLCAAALAMERNHRVGAGAVTEFDELFKIAFMSMIESLVAAAGDWAKELRQSSASGPAKNANSDEVLFECIEMATESMLIMWLDHSRTLRLSVLEKVSDRASWNRLVEFISQYGGDLFTQQLLQLGNLRAILHQGADVWLRNLAKSIEGDSFKIVRDLDRAIPARKAARYLMLVLEAILENYNEYRDYNSTTTQSDRGELLYMLLDFLRLRVKYDRISWHLRPVIWAHRILVRMNKNKVARMWRRSLSQRVGGEANRYLEKFADLQEKYSMRMMTISDRLSERFVRPMQIDRMRALTRQAMKNPASKTSQRAFEMLEKEIVDIASQPSGVGVDLPYWLASLQDEVQSALRPAYLQTETQRDCLIRPNAIPIAVLRERLENLPRRE